MHRILLLLVLFPASCFALITSALYGVYLEGNGGYSVTLNKPYPGTSYHSGFGWNVNGGYKFLEYFGAELGYTRYAEARIKNTAGATAATDDFYSYDAAGKLFFPLWGSGLELFGKIGYAGMHSYVKVNLPAAKGLGFNEGVHTGYGFYFGTGIDYTIIPNVQVNAQWARAKGPSQIGDLDLYSLGVSFIY